MKKPSLLFLTSRFPFPLEKGDKLRAYNLIRALSKDFDIQLFSLAEHQPSEQDLRAVEPYCAAVRTVVVPQWKCAINMLRQPGIPFQVAYFTDMHAMKVLREFVSAVSPTYVFCHLIRMAEYARGISGIRAIDYMDAFSTGMHRYAEQCPSLIKPFARIEASRLDTYEAKVFPWFQAHFIISEQDRNLIPHPNRNQIQVVRNGIDTEYFHPVEQAKSFDLLFNGHMSYPPNIASAKFSATQILPELRKIRPAATLLIAGANPGREIQSLQGNGVTVRGWMDDIREAFGCSRILVAPMLISIGLQNKILQAMAMRIPCVISSLANNALEAKPGSEVLVADTPEQYAHQIESLLSNHDLYQQVAEAGYRYVLRRFNWTQEAVIIRESLFAQD